MSATMDEKTARLIRRRGYSRNQRAKLRDAWFAANGPCKGCGSTKNLEVDHIDRTEKSTHRVWHMSREKREKELSKCQVLCRACHRAKTRVQLSALALARHLRRALIEGEHGVWT